MEVIFVFSWTTGGANFWNPVGWAILGIAAVATIAYCSYTICEYSKSKSDPYARPGQKKQHREIKEKKKANGKDWIRNPNKKPSPFKKHTPGRDHRKYKR